MMSEPARRGGQDGSILLPVMLLLLLIATAATAMTLKARTSLREAAIRRDRLVLAATTDGVVRATAMVLTQSLSARKAPPFRLDGTPEICALPGSGEVALAVQDAAGLVDLNKASAELIGLVLGRAGLGGAEATALGRTILAHRSDGASAAAPAGGKPAGKAPAIARASAQDFGLVDELADLPGVSSAVFATLRPLFTTDNGSNGIDPTVAAPAVQALIGAKELASPAFEAMVAPSQQSTFVIDALAVLPSGQRFGRRAAFRLDPNGAAGRFTTWTSPADGVVPTLGRSGDARFCRLLAGALMADR